MPLDYVCAKCKTPFQSHKKGKKYCSHECYAQRFDPVTKDCEACGSQFTVAYRFREQKTCNAACGGKLRSMQSAEARPKLNCLCCGTEFDVVESYKDKGKYCSLDCFYRHKYNREPGPVTIKCEGCGIDFQRPFIHRTARFCSKGCAHSGDRNGMRIHPEASAWKNKPAWNRGLTAKTDARLREAGEKISVIIADKIVNGEFKHGTGFKGEYYTGLKNHGVSVYLRSSYESRYVRMLDINPDVLSWEYEPFRIEYQFEGSTKNYVPDFFVVMNDETMHVIEVKPESLVETAQNVAKRAAAQEFCDKNGFIYKIISEEALTIFYRGQATPTVV